MEWDKHYRLWSEVRRQPGQEAYGRMQAARKRVAQNTPDDWRWLAESLVDTDRKWFVADVFKFQPVPKRLFEPMLRAGVLERDPSFNRVFVEPCVRSLGERRVLRRLLRYLESGTDAEKAGAASALYWVRGNPRAEELGKLRERIVCQLFHEFVGNPDLDVRRRIIPSLPLKSGNCPEEVRSLIPVVIDIARSHPDEYIRHRLEDQLGSGGSLMAIPNTKSE